MCFGLSRCLADHKREPGSALSGEWSHRRPEPDGLSARVRLVRTPYHIVCESTGALWHLPVASTPTPRSTAQLVADSTTVAAPSQSPWFSFGLPARLAAFAYSSQAGRAQGGHHVDAQGQSGTDTGEGLWKKLAQSKHSSIWSRLLARPEIDVQKESTGPEGLFALGLGLSVEEQLGDCSNHKTPPAGEN